MLRNDEDLLQRLSERFRQYGKGSKEEQSVRTAHNARNRFTNEYHTLERRVKRIEKYPTLFDVSDTLRLTPDQQKVLGRS